MIRNAYIKGASLVGVILLGSLSSASATTASDPIAYLGHMVVTAPRIAPLIDYGESASVAAADLGAMIVTARRETSLARL